MQSFVSHLKLLPVVVLAVLAVSTSVQMGCGGSISAGPRDDGTREDAAGREHDGWNDSNGYGYGGYGYGGYGYGR